MRPPIKAIEQIKNYCERTQCRKCIYGVRDNNYDIDYVGCKLQRDNPCDWEIEENKNENSNDLHE